QMLFRPYPFVHQPFFGYQFLLLPFAIGWVVWTRSTAVYPVLGWLVLLYLPLSFATLDFKTFAPAQLRVPRVLEPLCVPSMVLIAAFVAPAFSRFGTLIFLGFVTVTSLLFSFQLHYDARQELQPVREVYETAIANKT